MTRVHVNNPCSVMLKKGANFKSPENGNVLEEVSSLKGTQRLCAICVTGCALLFAALKEI